MTFEMRIKSSVFSDVCILIILPIVLFSCKINRPPPNHLRINVIENGIETTKDIERTKVGSLDKNQLKQVNHFLTKVQPLYPDSTEFVYVKYYPGKDICNSTGNSTRNDIGKIDLYIQSEIQKRNEVTAVWIFKDNAGLERYDKETTWHFDEDHVVENTFFKYHFPCSSYVIIHKSGDYFAFYGESYYIQNIKDIDHFSNYIKNVKN